MVENCGNYLNAMVLVCGIFTRSYHCCLWQIREEQRSLHKYLSVDYELEFGPLISQESRLVDENESLDNDILLSLSPWCSKKECDKS